MDTKRGERRPPARCESGIANPAGRWKRIELVEEIEEKDTSGEGWALPPPLEEEEYLLVCGTLTGGLSCSSSAASMLKGGKWNAGGVPP